MSFILKPCLLKSVEIFIKKLTLGTFPHPFPTKNYLGIVFKAHRNALHILHQCTKTFHLSQELHLYSYFT